MIIIPIKYQSLFADEPVEKDFYFHLTPAEAIRLETDWHEFGGVEGRYDMLSKGDNPKFIRETIEELIYRAYGERVGEDLQKSQDLIDRFKSSPAYSELLMGLLTSDEPKFDANTFFKGIMPKNVDLKNPEKTASQVAREKSEAQFQGHQKKMSRQDEEDLNVINTSPEPSETEEERKQRIYEKFLYEKEQKRKREEQTERENDAEFQAFLDSQK